MFGKKKNKQQPSAAGVQTPPERLAAGGMDLPLAILVLVLVVFGLIMLFSASYANGYYRFGDSYHYIRSQLVFAAIGVVVMYIASRVDYHIFHRLAPLLMLLSLVLLVVVLFMPELNGAKRWIIVPGLGTFQPSEIAKFAVIVLFSNMISANADKMHRFSYGVVPFAAVLGVIAILMLLEPHLSGTVLIFIIGAVMMLVGGTALKWFGIAAAAGGGALATAVVAVPDLVPYAMKRVKMWLDPWSDPTNAGHQTIQSLYAIGSGGLFGLGLGNSRQKHLYVPEPQNDFIFSIICEELGFIGAMLVIILFAALLIRGATIALYARDRFGAMLVVGIITQVTSQAILNIAVVTNTIPNTGISLPFFSYGGTSLVILLCEMGVLLSVSRSSSLDKT